jgi:hypothetical protein
MNNYKNTVANWLLFRNKFVTIHVPPLLISAINPFKKKKGCPNSECVPLLSIMFLMENIKKWQTCRVATTLIASPVETSDGHETEGKTTQKDYSVTEKGIKAYNDNDNYLTINNNGLLAQIQYLNIIPADISIIS